MVKHLLLLLVNFSSVLTPRAQLLKSFLDYLGIILPHIALYGYTYSPKVPILRSPKVPLHSSAVRGIILGDRSGGRG